MWLFLIKIFTLRQLHVWLVEIVLIFHHGLGYFRLRRLFYRVKKRLGFKLIFLVILVLLEDHKLVLAKHCQEGCCSNIKDTINAIYEEVQQHWVEPASIVVNEPGLLQLTILLHQRVDRDISLEPLKPIQVLCFMFLCLIELGLNLNE